MADAQYDASPRHKARIAGALYLAVIVLGLYAEMFVRGPFIVSGDAAATARNIMAHEGVWRMAFAADLLADAFYVAVTVILYELLRPVNRSLSLTAAAVSLMGISLWAVGALFHLAPLIALSGAPYMAAFTPGQLQALAYAAIRLHSQADTVGVVFFGGYCAMIGWLIFRSRFMPRFVGVLLMLAGAGYLIDAFSIFLAPSLDLFTYIFPFTLAGEGSLTLWLLVVGVDTARWRERAVAAPVPEPAV